MTRTPDLAPTPYAEHEQLQSWIHMSGGGEVHVDFDASEGESDIQVARAGAGEDVPRDVVLRFTALTKAILSSEIGEWESGKGSIGTLRFSADELPWLNADSRSEDWTYEREPDDFEDLCWPDDQVDHGPAV